MPIRHGDSALKDSQHLAAPQLLANHDLLGRVDPVNLEYVLGDIQPDRGSLHLDGSLHVIRLRRSPYGTSMPGAGAVHHIKSCHSLQRSNLPQIFRYTFLPLA